MSRINNFQASLALPQPPLDVSGEHGEVTGGAHLDPMAALIEEVFVAAGFKQDSEVFSPGFAVQGRAGGASLQVSAESRPSVECLRGEPVPRSRAGSP
jgi:hypothetical protein